MPRICGQNTGQHVYVGFNGNAPISIAMESTGGFSFNRHWHFKLTQIPCASAYRAPSGCLQYYLDADSSNTGPIRSFNYGSMPSSQVNSIGVQGSRQLQNTRYGICIRAAANQCSITYSLPSNDPYAFTMTGDVGAVDPTLLGSVSRLVLSCEIQINYLRYFFIGCFAEPNLLHRLRYNSISITRRQIPAIG